MNARDLLRGADGVLSDMDGTLLDSSASTWRAWSALAARHGLDPKMVYAFVQGRPVSQTVPLLLPDADHAAEVDRLERDELADTDGVFALPGARELLSGSLRVAIVTSAPAALARARLAAAELPIPDVLVSVEDGTHGKPDPECFLLAAQRLGLAPARCVVLEDAPAGIAAGRHAGTTVIAVRTGHADSDLSEADVIIDGLDALLPEP